MTGKKCCDQCSADMINGIFCHEAGCPNQGKKWDGEREAWISYHPCSICGLEVEEGEICSCFDDENFYEPEAISDCFIEKGG